MNSSSGPGDVAPTLRTTTIFPGGTSLPIATVHHSQIPIAPIVGGAVGGVVLAVAAVIGWVWWGKCIERDQRKEKAKMVSEWSIRSYAILAESL